jgi:hypothetical protein
MNEAYIYVFNYKRFGKDLNASMKRGDSFMSVSEFLGNLGYEVSNTTVFRATKGEVVSFNNAIALIQFMNRDLPENLKSITDYIEEIKPSEIDKTFTKKKGKKD